MFIVVETSASFVVLGLERPGPTWKRAGVVLMVLVPWTLLVSGIVVHAPAFYILHALWLWLLVALISTSLLISLLWRVSRWMVETRKDTANRTRPDR